MRLGVLELVPAFGVCVRYPDGLFAQPLSDRTAAIETTLINSDYVFVATLVGLQPLDAGDERYGQRADIAIEETIKAELFREEPYTALNIYLPYRAAIDENIALVKPLIDDPQCFFHSAEGRSGERYRASRHAAYQPLKAWGMDVPQPVSREVVPWRRRRLPQAKLTDGLRPTGPSRRPKKSVQAPEKSVQAPEKSVQAPKKSVWAPDRPRRGRRG